MFRLTEFSDIDLDRLFHLSPNPYVLLDRELRFVRTDDASLAAIGRSRKEPLPRRVRDAFREASPATGRSRIYLPHFIGEEDVITESSNVPITVLLVEDEVLIRISTADLLQDSGMNVVEAGSADEALAAMRDHPVDILVTDVNLPEMSGPQLILKIRETLPLLPVIFATGDNNVPGVEELEHSAVIVKPYEYEILVTHIHAMVPSRDGG
ncbi:response regulator [Neorhizobium sp. Rsf11]|uniref:Response regulator n=1 Tax=Neorhizobium phenanthreniclasticum TaxID=3157917 RepID=A0ABV0M3K6_9HYPH